MAAPDENLPRIHAPDITGRGQELSDLDQTASDADQTQSETDQTAADADGVASISDQQHADLDQHASDRDQAVADREHADADADPSEQRTYDVSRAERADSSAARELAAANRANTELARRQRAQSRDDTARLRDETATTRDRAAEARDQAADTETDALLGDGQTGTPFRSFLAASQSDRGQAASDRARAGRDRERAASDRAQAGGDRRRALLSLQRAQHDSLTGVYMRELGRATLQHEIDRARRSGEPFVLAFVDVNGLKQINDRRGHAAGDALLQSVVGVLESKMRSYDPIVRVGGDEFLCGFTNMGLDASRSRTQEMRAAVTESSAGSSITVGLASLGASETLEELTLRADLDMYAEKPEAPTRATRL
jgi:diguanylate cyclase (GGDEF)-like protein